MSQQPYYHNLEQGSEAWENIRKGKATASRFGDILTAKKLELSKSSKKYAVELVAERLRVESPDFMPTMWMDRGMEYEEYAINEFNEKFGIEVERVGFATPEKDSQYGCSPDGLVGDDATIQVKCPKAETLIGYHIEDVFPDAYKLQCQGEMWITGRRHCHFWAWHPELEPFHKIIDRDETVVEALEDAMPVFLSLVDMWCNRVQSRPMPPGFQFVDLGEDLE